MDDSGEVEAYASAAAQAYLDRIDRLDRRLRAYITVCHDEALEAAARAIEVYPKDARGHATYGWACFAKGRVEEGLGGRGRAAALAPGETQWRAQLGRGYGRGGGVEQARAVLATLEERARTGFVAPNHLAYVYTGLGEDQRAIDCLEQAFEQRAGAVYGIKGSFLFAPLRSHPRFVALLRRMHLA